MTMTEGSVQGRIRLQAAKDGVQLWRNNSGALKDQNGRLIRFGLGNDSAAVNRNFKSGDLIGIRQVMVTPDMVGKVIGVFVSIECKAEGWVWTGSDREVAQEKWNSVIRLHGGIAGFARSVDEARALLQ